MKITRLAIRSLNDVVSLHLRRPLVARTLSTNASPVDEVEEKSSLDSFEPADEFERRIFGGFSGNNARSDAFFQKLDRLERGRGWSGDSPDDGELDESFSTLSDGMEGKLQKAAMSFEFDPDEVDDESYMFRPDASFRDAVTYDIKDLDLTKPAVPKISRRNEFEVTTEEVLRKADFRNVRFLANFLTEAGIIIKRKQTGISAKAQRKVAREIKTARAFGLMPFTTMGTKSFVFGKTMECLDQDFEYETFDKGADSYDKDPLEA
ncbi:uncharacterized protein LOC110809994 [Carica papaya]|uniref:uncharacterized protein LOC110809994 n=1 Tax=Carica papaya TaxID=3649 RepID=UPI000B8CA230|nr:uncharacterized protein LOC110809994 [Carica papaya]